MLQRLCWFVDEKCLALADVSESHADVVADSSPNPLPANVVSSPVACEGAEGHADVVAGSPPNPPAPPPANVDSHPVACEGGRLFDDDNHGSDIKAFAICSDAGPDEIGARHMIHGLTLRTLDVLIFDIFATSTKCFHRYSFVRIASSFRPVIVTIDSLLL